MEIQFGIGLLDPAHGPLSSEDIALIETELNFLICDLFEDEGEEVQAEELAMDLPYKIEQYVGFADYIAANDPAFKDTPGVAELPSAMRELLRLVNEYYHRQN